MAGINYSHKGRPLHAPEGCYFIGAMPTTGRFHMDTQSAAEKMAKEDVGFLISGEAIAGLNPTPASWWRDAVGNRMDRADRLLSDFAKDDGYVLFRIPGERVPDGVWEQWCEWCEFRGWV